jgi:hypothetical protein
VVVIREEDYVSHYGVPRRSGRYPWGSGGQKEHSEGHVSKTRNKSFLDYVKDMEGQGLSQKEIAQGLNMTTTELRDQRTIARNAKIRAEIDQINRLASTGMSNGEIAKEMGLPGESSVRARRKQGVQERADIYKNVSTMLKDEVDARHYVDVGKGVEAKIGISSEKLRVSLAMLKEQGYNVHIVPHPQIGTQHDTDMKILVRPGVTQKDAFLNRDKIQQISLFTPDGGRAFSKKIHNPISIDPSRLKVVHKEEGGDKADGVIFVREGVKDISLGKSRYAQVRIKVGKDKYLKGMAMYSDDLPKGIDLEFHTKKRNTGNKLDSLGDIEKGLLPFGAVTKPLLENEGSSKERPYSAMNLIFEQGDWTGWSRNLSSQFLSKQSPTLAKGQLDKVNKRHRRDLDEIMSLTNPTVRKRMLWDFANETDSAAVQMEAAAINSGQRWHAILPLKTLSPTQVYAPNYKNGESVVLVRFPHGGTFEIPELTVNNRNPEGRKLLRDAKDAIGIHHTVAERLSGADFDGDTVIVIPNQPKKVRSSRALEGLKDFDPIAAYPKYPGMKVMTKAQKGHEMGVVSNLITDMTIKGAPHEKIAKAIRHSMVVIDANKHELNWKQSYIDNGINQLKKEYQGKPGGKYGGSTTLLSRAGAPAFIPKRKERPAPQGGPINVRTGRREWVPTNKRKFNKKTGEWELVKEKFEQLAITDNARDLSSGTRMENLYADHSNSLKAMANEARLGYLNTPRLNQSRSAKQVYAKEVASLDFKLKQAYEHAPLERQAQVIARANVRAKTDSNPTLSKDQIKKLNYQELEVARTRMKAGKKKTRIDITDEEWNAIQAGAIAESRLQEILANTDTERIRKLATPKRRLLMSSSKTTRARAMLARGHTRAEVADALGVSLTTLDTSLEG